MKKIEKYFVYSKLTGEVGPFDTLEEAQKASEEISKKNGERFPNWKAIRETIIYKRKIKEK